MFKKGSTMLLKITLVFMTLIVLVLAVFALPNIYKGALIEFPGVPNVVLGIIIAMYAVTVPYFLVMWQSWKLLILIDQNKGFSEFSIKAFRSIKFASLVGGLILMIGFVPLLYPIAQLQDAPGLLVIGFAFSCIPFVVAIFASLLEKLFQNALDMKSENELTI